MSKVSWKLFSPVSPKTSAVGQARSLRRSLRPPNIIILALLLASCGDDQPKERIRVIGEGYVGPASVPIRQEISVRSREVAQLKHGEKVAIVEKRRSFLRVQRSNGTLGWLTVRQLMSKEQIDALAKLSAAHKNTPKVGQATVYEPLNLHNEPNRQSPGFAQIPEKGIVDVLAYQLAPRVPYQPPQLVEPPKPVVRGSKKKKDHDERVQLPPPPAAPAPPKNWIDLSKTPPAEEEEEPAPPPPPQLPVKQDDWTLVRMPDGTVGWALSSMLVMAIPDEVAQYSEGHRIMGYWPLAEIMDGDVKRNHWLWVTQSQRGQPFPFDGFRIFMYSAKRHRYEQAYREKKVIGYFPVEVVRPGRKKDYLAEFSIITEDETGQKIRRTFAFLGYQVTLLDTQIWVPPTKPAEDSSTQSQPTPPSKQPWYKRWFRRS